MRCVCLVYHSNASQLYPKEWIDDFVESVKAQTYQDFEVWELAYDGGKERFFNGVFWSKKMKSFIQAMNFLIDQAMKAKVDVLFNTNCDDINHPQRFERQLYKILEGYQIISCNFRYFGEQHKDMHMTGCGDIGENLKRNHNVMCHPAICTHSSFWEGLRYNEDSIGFEDLELWKEAYRRGRRFYICEEYLLDYRINPRQVTKKYDSNGREKVY